MKIDVKKQISNTIITQAYRNLQDAAPESYQVRPESLETFEPSFASSKMKNENHPIQNQISDFDKRHISQPKNQ